MTMLVCNNRGIEMALFNRELEKAAEPGLLSRIQTVPLSSAPVVEEMLPPPSQITLAPNGNRTYLDQGSKVHGKLNFEAPVQIDGQIDGEIDAPDTSVTIGKSAVVTAKIKALLVTVAGVVNGEIRASQRIELQPSARVSGSLTAPKLVVQEGAMFDGNCTMPSKAVPEDRKPGTSRKEEHVVANINGRVHAEQA
jgi:cytoskeletal protein CcmA (bactofilin family)